MNKVVIFADSTIDLNLEDYKKFDIHVIPLLVSEGDKTYKDCVDLFPDELYAMVEKNGRLPKTSAESPGTLIEAYRPWIEKGYDIVFVGIGEKLSATVTSSKLAARELGEDRIYTINSDNLSSASGLLAMKCCKLRDENKSAEQIYNEVQKLSSKVVAMFAVETLDYLYKGGRCSGTARLFGKMLHIHPIIRVVDGSLIVYKKPRGKMQKAIDEQVFELKHDLPYVDMDHIMITSAGVTPEIKKYFFDAVSKYVDPKCIHESRAGCVISSHCGFGTIGLLYIKTK